MLKGDMWVLLKGVMVLDFVFSIYFDVGYYCIVIKIDNQIVLMGCMFKNGDCIEVVISVN